MPKKPTNGNGAKRPRGRPPKPIDLELLEELAALQCTHAEIASVLKVGRSTLLERMKNEPEIRDAYERGRESGKVSLRRLQWNSAKQGNVTMQIWLGKQYAGQSDKHESRVEQHVTGEIDLKGLEGKPYSERERMWRELVSGRG